MNTRIALLLLPLLFGPAVMRAEVEVYFGTVRRVTTQDDPASQGRKAYLVVDRNQKRIGTFSYGRDSIGRRHDFPTIEDVDFLEFGRDDGKAEDVFAYTVSNPTFTKPGGYRGIFLHGVQVPLVIGINGTSKNIQPRAKVLTGTIFGAAVSLFGPAFSDYTYHVTFSQKRTIEANGGASTVDTAIQFLVGIVEAQGFVGS